MIYLMAAVAGAFGSAFLRLLWEHSRDVCFVLAGLVFLCLRMKKSLFAKAVLIDIRKSKEKRGFDVPFSDNRWRRHER